MWIPLSRGGHKDREGTSRTDDPGPARCGSIGQDGSAGGEWRYPRPPPGGRLQNRRGWLVVLGRGGVDPALGGGDRDRDRTEELLDETLGALAVVATRLRSEQQRTTRLAVEVERLEGAVALVEERMDELAATLQGVLRGGA